MRALPLAAAVALALAPAAFAQTAAPAAVHVSVGPELMKKAQTTYGVAEVDRLAAELQADVSREMSRTGVLAGGKVELVLVDAVPNRPTFKQMNDRNGLSFHSFGVGGAKIEGQLVSLDGQVTPVSYKWYETDISESWPKSTWSDAQWTFGRFAGRLARGQSLASR
jgi:hypothetical protein